MGGRRAAERFRVAEAEQTQRGRTLVERAWEFAGRIPRINVRRDLALAETPHRVHEGGAFGPRFFAHIDSGHCAATRRAQ